MMVVIALFLMGPIASVASFFLKKAISRGLSIEGLMKSVYFYLGGILYVVSALLNLYLLKKWPYSVVVPLGALTYIWTLGIAHKFLGEAVTKQKAFGVILILTGVSLMTGTL